MGAERETQTWRWQNSCLNIFLFSLCDDDYSFASLLFVCWGSLGPRHIGSPLGEVSQEHRPRTPRRMGISSGNRRVSWSFAKPEAAVVILTGWSLMIRSFDKVWWCRRQTACVRCSSTTRPGELRVLGLTLGTQLMERVQQRFVTEWTGCEKDFQSWLCCLRIAWSWEGCLTPVNPNFLICKNRMKVQRLWTCCKCVLGDGAENQQEVFKNVRNLSMYPRSYNGGPWPRMWAEKLILAIVNQVCMLKDLRCIS